MWALGPTEHVALLRLRRRGLCASPTPGSGSHVAYGAADIAALVVWWATGPATGTAVHGSADVEAWREELCRGARAVVAGDCSSGWVVVTRIGGVWLWQHVESAERVAALASADVAHLVPVGWLRAEVDAMRTALPAAV